MASTRNKNSILNYNVEKKKNENTLNYNNYLHSQHGEAHVTFLPDFGVNPGAIPRNKLKHSSVDVESDLRGIQCTNLETPHIPENPSNVNMGFLTFYKTQPLHMPEDFFAMNRERPMKLN